MNKAKQDTVLGAVFFAALGLLLYATYALTDLSFEERPSIEVFCDNAGGIRSGDPVFVLGNRNGQVGRIEYLPGERDPERRIKLRLDLREPVMLRSDARIDITSANLLGGRVVEIEPGVGDAMWPEAEPYRAQLKPTGIEALGDLIDDPKVQDDFTAIVSGVRAVVDSLNSTEGTLGLLINETGLYDDVRAAVRSAERSLQELERGQSPLGRLIYSEEDGARLSSALASIDDVATKIDEGEGLVGRIINDEELGADAKRLVADAAEIVTDAKAGKGTIGRLLRDDELADRVRVAVDGFAEFASNASDPEAGLIGALVSDKDLRDKGATIIANLEAISEELKSGKGTLARLINDEEMGEKLDRVLNQVSRAIEDAREAAPVGTFFQVLTGAF